MRRKTWLGTALGAALVALCAAAAGAAGTADSLTVTITPNASYAIAITTVASGANLGAVSLGASTSTVRPSTVTVTSTYAYTGLKLQGAIASAGTPWTLSSNTASPAQDVLAAWAMFTDTGTQTAPATAGTVPGNANSDVMDAAQRIVGATGGACPTEGSTALLFTVAGGKKMECLKPQSLDYGSGTSFLWLSFTLPPATTSASAQNVTVTLTAGAPN